MNYLVVMILKIYIATTKEYKLFDYANVPEYYKTKGKKKDNNDIELIL